MLSRRTVLLGTTAIAAVGLGGCPAGSDTTVQGIIDTIKATCHFTTSIEPIVQVILTIVSGFNVAAGASATVAAAIAKTVVDMVCGAVKAQVAQIEAGGAGEIARPTKLASPTPITVVVNGVKVPGTYQP